MGHQLWDRPCLPPPAEQGPKTVWLTELVGAIKAQWFDQRLAERACQIGIETIEEKPVFGSVNAT